MRKITFTFSLIGLFLLFSCDKDSDTNEPTIETPASYSFERNNQSTIDFSGQTTRILMAEELASAMMDNTKSYNDLAAMFSHNQGSSDFSDESLNASDKNIRSKVAASYDLFSANATDAASIKADFDLWLATQVDEVFPNWENDAVAGQAGQIQVSGGGSIRYVDGKGVEMNQIFSKSLIGALMLDQILNNYLSSAVLDEGTNRSDNDNDVLVAEKNYTNMEHKWDEAFGYLYGTEGSISSPSLGADSFLNKYLDRLESDEDFAGIAQDVLDAFKLGRAAIVAKDYDLRDEQARIIRRELSKVPAVRSIYYLQDGKNLKSTGDLASAFHSLSEGIGFIYSLQFTRNPSNNQPYYTKAEVDQYLEDLLEGNGFWEVSDETLDRISQEISDRFSITISEAYN